MQNETTAIAIVIGSVQRKRYVEQKHKSGKTQVSKEPECNREETDFRPWHLDNTNTSFYIVKAEFNCKTVSLCLIFFYQKKNNKTLCRIARQTGEIVDWANAQKELLCNLQ